MVRRDGEKTCSVAEYKVDVRLAKEQATGNRRQSIVWLFRGEQIASGGAAERWHCGDKLHRSETAVIGYAVWNSVQVLLQDPTPRTSVLGAEPASSVALPHCLGSRKQLSFKR